MAIEKLTEFAKEGQKNTDDLDLEKGFIVNRKPARQWFNWLFNTLTAKINEVIDADFMPKSDVIDNLMTNNATKPVSAKQAKLLQDNKFDKSGGEITGGIDVKGIIRGNSYLDLGIGAPDGNKGISFYNQDGTGRGAIRSRPTGEMQFAGATSYTFDKTIGADISGNAATATKLATARTIGGVSFDGTTNINLPGVNAAGNQNTSGNAASATKLATAHTIALTGDLTGSGSFDGSSNISISVELDDASRYMPIPYPKNKPPPGYLAMQGQAINSSTYPKLYALYGSNLPDLRGQFIRGLDNGKGIDSGRTVLSLQEDDFKSHSHKISPVNVVSGSGVGFQGNNFQFTNNKNTEAMGGVETRPKNIAFLYIVKAG